MTPHAIHGRTGIPLEIIESGLDHLSKPDPYSRSSAEEGRRIVLLDEHRPWGWRLVNHDYYNKLRSAEEKRIADRDRISEKRKSIKSEVSRDVAECSGQSRGVADVAPITVAVTVTKEPKALDASRPTHDYTEEFESAWLIYPKRAGGNPKPKAFKAWTARTKQCTSTATMVEGAKRYAAFCIATGKLNTEYVMQAATFFGPDRHFSEQWTLPSGGTNATHQPVDNSAVGKVRAANERARQREAANRRPDASGVGTDGEHVRPPLDQ